MFIYKLLEDIKEILNILIKATKEDIKYIYEYTSIKMLERATTKKKMIVLLYDLQKEFLFYKEKFSKSDLLEIDLLINILKSENNKLQQKIQETLRQY